MQVIALVRWWMLAGICIAGCAKERVNPSFVLDKRDARRAVQQMEACPRPLERPLVILGGFADPGFHTSSMRSACRKLFSDERIIVVNFTGTTNFQQCSGRVVEAVEEAFPSSDPQQTIEVDVVGLSMGGLVARVAAEMEYPEQKRLQIARLFAVSSPLRGAKLARYPLVLTSMHRDMREGSELMVHLNDEAPPYEVFCYTKLNDPIVGEELAAPARQTAWWLDSPSMGNSHFGAMIDPRILADIARRLRGEQPFTTDPPAPLPVDAEAD